MVKQVNYINNSFSDILNEQYGQWNRTIEFNNNMAAQKNNDNKNREDQYWLAENGIFVCHPYKVLYIKGNVHHFDADDVFDNDNNSFHD